MAHGVTARSDSDLGDLGPVERALGPEFASLHPKIQEQYAIRPSDDFYWRGAGTMRIVRNGGWHVRPFASLGARRRILFAETGRDVPFIIENHAYIDSFGRATVTWLREFDFEVPRRFDEYVVYCEERGTAAVLAGTLFEYRGEFTLERVPKGQPVLTRVRPRRENPRV